MLCQKNPTARCGYSNSRNHKCLHPLFTTAWPNCSKLCGLLHFWLGCSQQKISAILKLSMYKVSTPKHTLLEMWTKHSKRDRGEEKLAVVQNTPRQQFEIDDTPEPTPDYDQVFCFFRPSHIFLLLQDCSQTNKKLEEEGSESKL